MCPFTGRASLNTPERDMSRKKRRMVRKSSPESGNRWHWRSRPVAWIIASLAGAAVPIILYFVYARFPGARPWIALGNDGPFQPAFDEKGKVVVPLWGFPVQGAYLSLFLSAVIAYWGVGFLLSFRKAASTEEEEKRIPPVLIPAISVLLFTLPTISAAWALTLKAGVSHDFPWEIFKEQGTPLQNLIIMRRVLSFAVRLPHMSAALCAMSFVVKPSRQAIILGIVGVAVFVTMALCLNWMGG
jgi:hypothetical protein